MSVRQCSEQRVVCRYSEVLQRAELKRHVLALAYGYAAALTYAVACVGDMRNSGATPLTSPLLAPINALLQWLATQPEYVRCVPCCSLSVLHFTSSPASRSVKCVRLPCVSHPAALLVVNNVVIRDWHLGTGGQVFVSNTCGG